MKAYTLFLGILFALVVAVSLAGASKNHVDLYSEIEIVQTQGQALRTGLVVAFIGVGNRGNFAAPFSVAITLEHLETEKIRNLGTFKQRKISPGEFWRIRTLTPDGQNILYLDVPRAGRYRLSVLLSPDYVKDKNPDDNDIQFEFKVLPRN